MNILQVKNLLSITKINSTQEPATRRSQLENILLDYSSASSNTGSGGTKHAPSAQHLAEVFFFFMKFFVMTVDNFETF